MRRNKRSLNSDLLCSFCGKSQHEVRKLIAGPSVYICDECIKLCTDIIDEELVTGETKQGPPRQPFPHDIKDYLDQYVIGQERAKKVLSVAVYNHYKRISAASDDDGVELSKSNILLLGPTGTGKTLMAQTLARILDVPFTIADATTLTEAGYVGEDAENIIANLLIAADNDLEKASRGIVYIDEIDKLARRSGDSPSTARDVGGEGVQQALLKIVEGITAMVTPHGSRGYGNVETVPVDTTNILFICGGTFTGIEQYIQRRTGHKAMGFGATIQARDKRGLGELLRQVEPDDMVKYGLIPELVGRLPVIATLDDLTLDNLRAILTQPRNALTKQYQVLFEIEKIKLAFHEEAIKEVARRASKRPAAARALRSILEECMLDIMYEVPFLPDIKECHITVDVIRRGDPPLLIYEKKTA